MISPQTHILRRAFASFVDYFLLVGFAVGVFAVQPWAHPDETGNYGAAGCLLLIPVVLAWCFYFGWVEARYGRTLGKGLLDLFVERLDGKRLTTGDCLKRHVLDPFELHFVGIPAAVAVMLTPQHQRLGDMLAGTRVVLKPYEPQRASGS